MYRSSYGQNEEITSELYLNEWMESGQAEMGEKVQGSCLIYSENFHHREWKLTSTEILITSFYHKKINYSLINLIPTTICWMIQNIQYYPNYPKYSIENLDPTFIRGMFKILIYLRLRELKTKMHFPGMVKLKI